MRTYIDNEITHGMNRRRIAAGMFSAHLMRFAFGLLILPFAAQAGSWYVSPSGDGTAPQSDYATGYATIEAALAAANADDTILVAPGTYVLSNAAGIAVTNGVHLVGRDGPDTTIVSAMPNGTSESKLLKLVDGYVEGITFSNACMTTKGDNNAMIHATGASVIKNCVLTDFTCPGGNGHAVYVAGTTEMSDTVIRNISTSNTTTFNQLVAVYLAGSANVHDCIITNNMVRRSGYGTVTIASANAALRRSLVKDNTHIRVESRNGNFAGGVCISAGTLEDCVIDGNAVKGSSLDDTIYAGGLCISGSNTKIRRCVISNNRSVGTAAAAGVYAHTGSTSPYQDLLIINNEGSTGKAGGLQIGNSGATFAHCTIYGNTLTANTTGTPGAYITTGKLINSIVYGNGVGDTRFTTNNVIKESAGTLTSCNVSCAYEADLGTGNVAGNPYLVDPENGDYGLTLVSPGRDAGVTVTGAVALDLAGATRPQGDAVDMGCYEFVPDANPECAIAADTDRIPVGGTVTVTNVALPEAGIASYQWTIRDTTGERTETTATPFFRYTGVGACTAEISCTVHWSNEEEATSRAISIAVLPTTVHASLTGGHVWPFDTEAKAATNIQQAIDAVYGTSDAPGIAYVHAGVWDAGRGQDATATHLYAVAKPARLIGIGTVILDGENNRRILHLNHIGASVTNMTFTQAYSFQEATAYGSALYLSAGMASDCVISNCNSTTTTTDALLFIHGGVAERMTVRNNTIPTTITAYSQALAPVYMKGGTLRDSLITGNRFADRAYGGAVCLNGPAVMEDCEISGNTAIKVEYSNYCAGGVSVRGGGIVRRCRIINNTRAASGTIYRCAGGVNTYDGNATIEACVITNNTAGTSNANCIPAAGVLVDKNTVFRNCLIANNRQTDSKANLRAGGVYLAGAGALENCTVYGNSSTQVTNSGIYQVAGTVTNCIAWANGATVSGVFEQHDLRQTGGTSGYSCFGETVAGTGNISANPVFVKPASGDFHVRSQSPCVHAGIAIDGLVTDIEGGRRKAKRPTMGCYRFAGTFATGVILR